MQKVFKTFQDLVAIYASSTYPAKLTRRHEYERTLFVLIYAKQQVADVGGC